MKKQILLVDEAYVGEFYTVTRAYGINACDGNMYIHDDGTITMADSGKTFMQFTTTQNGRNLTFSMCSILRQLTRKFKAIVVE